MDTGRLPLEWIEYNCYNAIMSPSTTHCNNNELVTFLQKYLIQKCMSVFEFTLPESVDETYFLYVLFVNGWIILANDEKFGEVAHYASLRGSNMYRHPKEATIMFTDTDATLAHELTVVIDPLSTEQTGVMLKLQKNYSGFMDLVTFYAEKLALVYEAMDMNIINSHLAYVFGSANKAAAETFKKMYDNIASGQPAVAIDKDMFDEEGKPRWMAFFNNLKQNFIAPDMMVLVNQIEREFDTKIGIPSANTDKRERLTDDEVNSNNFATLTFIEQCLRSMKTAFKKCRELGIWSTGDVKLVVPTIDDLKKSADEGGKVNGEFNTDSDRTV